MAAAVVAIFEAGRFELVTIFMRITFEADYCHQIKLCFVDLLSSLDIHVQLHPTLH
jgi:hypothetical protein